MPVGFYIVLVLAFIGMGYCFFTINRALKVMLDGPAQVLDELRDALDRT
jgi:hypothetical protein